MRLAGQVGIVTGSSRGLGREIAVALAREGMALALLARSGSALHALAEELSACVPAESLLPFALDVRDGEAVARMLATVEQRLGPVDLLVQAAAVVEAQEVPYWQADPSEVRAVLETDLLAPMLLTRAVLPAMVAAGRGRVVTVASEARAAVRTGTYTSYAVAKRALSLFTGVLAPQLTGTGVVVVDVLPGLVRTALTGQMAVWRDVTDWDDASATAELVASIALGRHDDAHGTVLDAPGWQKSVDRSGRIEG